MDISWHDRILMVIPSINGSSLLHRMLPTVDLKPSSILVLDQGSRDDTAAVCASNNVGVLQLGQPKTYTQASNIGFTIARERGAEYLCVANNDITFRTKVVRELFEEMENDPGLGIVAPSQVVVDRISSDQALSYRVSWRLDEVEFHHDTQVEDPGARRLESDFCELTCALIRMSAIDDAGFFDDEFGFYHEDADFGFRLRKAGYTCAYLPKSQINHFLSSTISEECSSKARYIAKNRVYFAQKHLGYGVRHSDRPASLSHLWGAFNRDVHAYLRRYGLLDREASGLVVSSFASEATDYILLPNHDIRTADWSLNELRRLRAVFTSSMSAARALSAEGVANTFCVPPGIEPDIFHPWGATRRSGDLKTYLMMVDGHQSRLLGVVLEAWQRFSFAKGDVLLILCGRDLEGCVGRRPDACYRLDNADIARHLAERIDVHHLLSALAAHDLAGLYRGADYVIVGTAGEDDELSAIHSLACGTPCLRVSHEWPAAMGPQHSAGMRHGFVGVGEDGERATLPSPVEAALASLEISYALSLSERQGLAQAGFYEVRTRFTLRNTAIGIRGALTQLQIRNPGKAVARIRDDDLMTGLQSAGGTEGATQQHGNPMSRTLVKAGRLASHVGLVWQDDGFSAASRLVRTKVVSFASRRLHPLSSRGSAAASAVRKWGAGPPAVTQGSALLIGYIDAQLGLGESLRGLASAVSHSTVPFGIYPFAVGVEGRRSVAFMPERYDLARIHEVNVIEVTPDELPAVFSHVSSEHFEASYNILRTYWELSKAPEHWRPHLDRIDELWVADSFVAESFRTIFDRTISIVPPCVNASVPALDGRAHFGLDDDAFYFLFSFDYFSFPERKNPLGVVRAFRRAFPDVAGPARLIIKSAGSVDHFPGLKRALRVASQDDPRIRIIDASLTREQMLALLAASDCYVSLHRSEGFGLGMAEAMVLGKPVVATNYSGNTDFLSELTGYPVPYTLRPIPPGDYIYAEGQVWAEPDEAEAAAMLARILEYPAEASAKAAAGRSFAADRYGPVHVSRVVEARLAGIFAQSRESRGTKR